MGPGSGFTAFRLARHIRHMTLLEVSPTAVARLRASLSDLRNVRVFTGDITDPHLPVLLHTTYDAAFGLDVFEYVQDPSACLKNLAALLRPGGQLLLTFPNVPPPAGDGVTWFDDLEVLESLLTRAGFETWSILAVHPRPFAAAVYATLHEWPLRLYRRFRSGNGRQRPQTYEATWAFQNTDRLSVLRIGIHLAWAVLDVVLKLGGTVFRGGPVPSQPLGRQLVVRAIR